LAWFFTYNRGFDINTFLKKKYVAYLVLLAGWIGFCYWLFAKEIWPRYQRVTDSSGLEHVRDLEFPLAFAWGSDIPLAGKGYGSWLRDMREMDTTGLIWIMKGYYFLDEKGSVEEDEQLALSRIDQVVDLIGIPKDRILFQLLQQEINADVRQRPFEATGMERFYVSDLYHLSGDTLELCFPLKDSLTLPPLLWYKLDEWLSRHSKQMDEVTRIVGIADGSGIAESSDIALDRAIIAKERMKENGWDENKINLSTGQRSKTKAVQNRCVIIF
jgi:hypothetical protein